MNGTGRVHQIIQRGDNWLIEIDLPDNLKRYALPEGSIAIDGISLTIAQIKDDRIGLSIIPYTYKNTTIKNLKTDDYCNIETDIIGRYVEKMLHNTTNEDGGSKITPDWLQKQGF